MKITHYSFGRITINDKTYTADVIIYPDRVDFSWWRKEGHYLQVVDLTDVINSKPEVLIIGTGYYGVMEVPESVVDFIRSKVIEVHVHRTMDAINLFNEISGKNRTIAALHLTC